MKKISLLIIISIFSLIIFTPFTVYSEKNTIKVIIDGEQINFDVEPTIINGRTLVPLRQIFEKFGLELEWDSNTSTVTGIKDGVIIQLVIGDKIAKKNGMDIILDVPPQIINGRTMVPIRFIGESLGANVNWDSELNAVIIKSSEVNGEEGLDIEIKVPYMEMFTEDRVAIDIINKNKSIKLTKINVKYFDNNDKVVTEMNSNKADLDYLYRIGQNSFGFNTRVGNVKYIKVYIEGINANGKLISGNYYLDYTNAKSFYYTGYNHSLNTSSEYDTKTLRHNADYKIPVSEGVYWVPVNTLGKSNLTQEEIADLGNDPETLKEKIDTVYEVIQYIQAADFKAANDNIRIKEGNINWEHHKPGELAITTNEGSCATISNLFNYLLEDDYDEVGFIQYSQADGSGHVFNYIKQAGKYYLIDLTHYRNDFMRTAIESGKGEDYTNSDFIAGNLHVVDDLHDYTNYMRAYYNNPPELISIYQADNSIPLDSLNEYGQLKIVYPYNFKEELNIIYDDTSDRFSYAATKPPVKYPEAWEPFNTRYQYIVNAEDELDKPYILTGYNTTTLRNDADFKLGVYDRVYWVPINTLGKSNLTAEEIRELGNDPEILKENIDTLYEVIQYIQIANFIYGYGNIDITEGEIDWEHHKPGEVAIRTNNGDCSTVSGLLNYLLEDDYDEVGFIQYSQADGSGHVFNYIKQNGKYYLIDLTHYRNDFMNTATESGHYQDYYNTDYIAGNLHEVDDLNDYIAYVMARYNNPPELFSIYQAKNVLPIASLRNDKDVKIVYPNTYKENIIILYDDIYDQIYFYFAEPPKKYPLEWEPYNTKY